MVVRKKSKRTVPLLTSVRQKLSFIFTKLSFNQKAIQETEYAGQDPGIATISENKKVLYWDYIYKSNPSYFTICRSTLTHTSFYK